MATQFLYKVHPADPSTMIDISKGRGTSPIIGTLAAIIIIFSLLGAFLFFINLFSGGSGWFVCLVIVIASLFIQNNYQKEADIEFAKQQPIPEAEMYSKQLNDILTRSEEIANDILPSFEASVLKSIEMAKVDFSRNATSRFWGRIEEAVKFLAFYKEAVDQLLLLGELYSRVLDGKKHTFPIPFPIGFNISVSQILLDDFNSIIRKAEENTSFAVIWEIRRNTAVNMAGFKTLEQAINNMTDAVVASIYDLKYSIKSEFKKFTNIQIEQLKSFESSQSLINKTLESMDTKLYYLQYNEKPSTPFVRPLFD